MSTHSRFARAVVQKPELAQLTFEVAVLEPYLAASDVQVMRTRSVGRVKASTWSVDFGVAPDEATIHVTLSHFAQKVPDKEREHWFAHASGDRFSENYLKMQSGHACIDDGALRAWGEEEQESFF